MNIYFSPISMLGSYTLEVSGDSVVINGEHHQLAALAAIDENEPLPPFVAGATADSVTLLLPYWGQASESVLFPDPVIDVPDGTVEWPQ